MIYFALMFTKRLDDGLFRDPRFPLLCARLGLCDYWATSDRWPDCAADETLGYDFKAACVGLAAPARPLDGRPK